MILQSIKDSIFNLETDQKIDKLLFSHEIDKKQGEIAILVKDKEIQKMEVEKAEGNKECLRCWLSDGAAFRRNCFNSAYSNKER